MSSGRSAQTLLLAAREDRAVDLWATSHPGASSALLLALVLAGAAAVALKVLCGRPDEPTPAPDDPLEAEAAAVAAARRRVEAALAGSGDALRAVATPLIEGPLLELDRRVERLLLAARAARSGELAADAARLEHEEARLRGLLSGEGDPRGRALLQASLSDLAAARTTHLALCRRARLAGLELQRLRVLLDALPARLRELAAGSSLDAGDAQDVEHIAHQLEEAVLGTTEVLELPTTPRKEVPCPPSPIA